MAIPWVALGPVFWRLAKEVIEEPLVYRWIDNAVKGTETWVDDLVWRVFRSVADISDPGTFTPMIKAKLADVQGVYDRVKAAKAAGEDVGPERVREIAAALPWIDSSPAEG